MRRQHGTPRPDGAGLVNNLLFVLCSDHAAQPVINTGAAD